jgi:hypothetical protein
MADVRINGRRYPSLQSIDSIQNLFQKLEHYAFENRSEITSMFIDGKEIEIEEIYRYKIKLHTDEKIEVQMQTPEEMSFECLQVALEMAELLVFDIKVATINVWDGSAQQIKTLQTLLQDAEKFLLLASRPVELLKTNINRLPSASTQCLQQLDLVALNLEDTALLVTTQNNKEACFVLIKRLLPSLEKWIGLSAVFAEQLQINPSQTTSAPT